MTATPMRVLICGDRDWKHVRAIRRFLETLPVDAVVIDGAARGADWIAHNLWFEMCRRRGRDAYLQVRAFPAQWARYGRAAGPIRNQQMLDEGWPDRVVYFHNDLTASKGTKDMVMRARKAGIPVENGYDAERAYYRKEPK